MTASWIVRAAHRVVDRPRPTCLPRRLPFGYR